MSTLSPVIPKIGDKIRILREGYGVWGIHKDAEYVLTIVELWYPYGTNVPSDTRFYLGFKHEYGSDYPDINEGKIANWSFTLGKEFALIPAHKLPRNCMLPAKKSNV